MDIQNLRLYNVENKQVALQGYSGTMLYKLSNPTLHEQQDKHQFNHLSDYSHYNFIYTLQDCLVHLQQLESYQIVDAMFPHPLLPPPNYETET